MRCALQYSVPKNDEKKLCEKVSQPTERFSSFSQKKEKRSELVSSTLAFRSNSFKLFQMCILTFKTSYKQKSSGVAENIQQNLRIKHVQNTSST